MRISCALARLLGCIAEKKAADLGVPMSVAMVDSEGGLVFFSRMDGTLPVSTELSVSKAYTSAILRMSTEELGELAGPGGALYGIQHTHSGRIVLFGGGVPLRLQGRVAGAIGISGGTVDEDIQVAECVAECLEQMENWAGPLKDVVPSGLPDAIPVNRLECMLHEALEQIDCDLPPMAAFIVSGAIILACGAGPSFSGP
jgi:uncharacterized protein GlcG (DUF336 family)